MKTLRSFSLAVITVMAGLLLPGIALSQSSAVAADSLATTSWLVTVEGEAKTRVIVITATNPKADGSTELVATYGFTGGNMYPIQAQMAQSGGQRQFHVITPANTKIVATERPDGTFQGTFALKDGKVKGVVIAKSTVDLQVAAARKPSSDVPAECSGYVGAWVGRWSQGGFGDMYLRIAEVQATGEGCLVRYSYSSSAATVPGKKTAELKDGTITFACNSSTGGTCVFTRKSDALWASYSNPMGGQNSGVFKRVE